MAKVTFLLKPLGYNLFLYTVFITYRLPTDSSFTTQYRIPAKFSYYTQTSGDLILICACSYKYVERLVAGGGLNKIISI